LCAAARYFVTAHPRDFELDHRRDVARDGSGVLPLLVENQGEVVRFLRVGQSQGVQGHAGLLMAGGLWLLIVGTAWWHGYPTDQGGQPATFLTQTEFMEKLHAGLITHCIVSYNQKTFPITEIRGTFVEPEINSTTKDNPATRAEISFITPTVFLAPKMREELLASKNCEVETPANTLLGEIIDGIRHQLSNGRSGAR